MGDSVDFKITGVEELVGKLRGLTYDLRYKGGRAAMRSASDVIVNAAKANALRIDDPKTANSISKNIVGRWNKNLFKLSGNLGFRVGVLGGAKSRKENQSNPGGDTYYWRFIEFGTSKVPAKPFIRPALEQNLGNATDKFVTEYSKKIDRALKRAKKASIAK